MVDKFCFAQQRGFQRAFVLWSEPCHLLVDFLVPPEEAESNIAISVLTLAIRVRDSDRWERGS